MKPESLIESRFLLAVLVCLVLLGGVGCKYEPGEAEADPLAVENYPQITVSGSMVRQTFLAEKPVVRRGDEQPLSISVPLRLKQREELSVQYRFRFLDRDGVPLQIEPGWKYTVIRGREKTYFTGRALDTRGVDWQLEVREAK